MKFSKHQKEIIKQIAEGNVYDLYSYIKCFSKGHLIKLDYDEVHRKFEKDTVPKKLYHAKGLKKNQSNMLTASQYDAKLLKQELDPDEYIPNNISLRFDAGVQEIEWEGKIYKFDFYKGVLVAKSFADIMEFLILWQYLKSEMLILEVPQECSEEILGLFFSKKDNEVRQLSVDEQIKNIDLDDFTYSDQSYLGNSIYQLSSEHCITYKEYLNKKIYPSTTLELFVRRRFRSAEEWVQGSALLAAWLAIAVSIVLTFAPAAHVNKGELVLKQAIDNVNQNIIELQDLFENYIQSDDISGNEQVLFGKLDEIIDVILSNGISEEIPQQDYQK